MPQAQRLCPQVEDCGHRYYQCHIQLIPIQESCAACTRISIRCHNCCTKLNNMEYQLLKSILAALDQDHNSTFYDLVVQISNDIYHVIWISIFGFKILSLFVPQANTRIPPQQFLPVAIGKLKKIRLTWYTTKQRTVTRDTIDITTNKALRLNIVFFISL